ARLREGGSLGMTDPREPEGRAERESSGEGRHQAHSPATLRPSTDRHFAHRPSALVPFSAMKCHAQWSVKGQWRLCGRPIRPMPQPVERWMAWARRLRWLDWLALWLGLLQWPAHPSGESTALAALLVLGTLVPVAPLRRHCTSWARSPGHGRDLQGKGAVIGGPDAQRGAELT